MKIVFYIIAAGATFYWFTWRTAMKARINTLFIASDTVSTNPDWLVAVTNDWANKVNERNSDNSTFDFIELHNEMSNELCNNPYHEYNYWEKKETHLEYMNNMSNTQKKYFALVNFEGQVNNGGIDQFIYNQPENTLIVFEAMKDAGLDKLAKDYKKVLEHIFGSFETFDELKERTEQNLGSFEIWKAILSDKYQLPMAEEIEEYYYSEDYKKEYSKKLTEYVLLHQNELFRIKEK